MASKHLIKFHLRSRRKGRGHNFIFTKKSFICSNENSTTICLLTFYWLVPKEKPIIINTRGLRTWKDFECSLSCSYFITLPLLVIHQDNPYGLTRAVARSLTGDEFCSRKSRPNVKHWYRDWLQKVFSFLNTHLFDNSTECTREVSNKTIKS